MPGNKITLAHGSGGKENENIIKLLFRNVKIRNIDQGIGLDHFDDGILIPYRSKIISSIDSYTVYPIFFPGGDIGKLAATGSINDVAVMGAKPVAALDSIIVEEGFDIDDLKGIVNSMITVFENEDIALMGGDFKVMPKGKIDKIVITTSVIGILENDIIFLDSNVKEGDKIIVSGTIGEHGAVITALQMGIDADLEGLKSDCEPVTRIMRIVKNIGGVHAAKDPTRGGLAMTLNEFAQKSDIVIYIDENEIPIRENVKSFSEMLGIDPLYLASEGRVVLAVHPDYADSIVVALKKHGYADARIIGEAKNDPNWNGYVILETIAGGLRILEKPTGELTPRIC